MLTYIGGMQMTPGAMYAPSRTADPPGTMRTPAASAELLQRQRVFVVERPAAVVHRHVDGVAEPEAEQDALLHPGVDAPAGRAGRVGLGGADRRRPTARRAAAQTPSRARIAIRRRARPRRSRFDDRLVARRSQRSRRALALSKPESPSAPDESSPSTSRLGAAPSAAGTLPRAGPSPPSPP